MIRCNSFSDAAEECFVSQSAISQQVKALEGELGVKLLERDKHRFSLTPAGEHFYRQSLHLTADYEKLCRETLQISENENYTLRIGYLKDFGGQEFLNAVAEFVQKHPDIIIDTKPGNHEDLYEKLRENQIDLVLNDQRRPYSEPYTRLVLKRVRCQIEISTKFSVADRECINVDELRGIPCILVASKEQRENEEIYYREIYGISSHFLFADTLDEARLMVVSGKGFLPVESGSSPASYESSVVCLPLCRENRAIHRNYCAFWKSDNSGYYVEEFAEILRKQFEENS